MPYADNEKNKEARRRYARSHPEVIKKDTDDLDVRCFNHNILYEYELGRRSWIEK